MANTYTQIHLQLVFAVQNRKCLIKNEWKDELYRYITGIVQSNDHKLLQINGMPDHVHLLIGLRPTQSIAELMKNIKEYSSRWINKKGFLNQSFKWQEGYGAFSYSKNHVQMISNYIKNQELHHAKNDFVKEYIELLNKHNIKYDPRYIFKPVL